MSIFQLLRDRAWPTARTPVWPGSESLNHPEPVGIGQELSDGDLEQAVAGLERIYLYDAGDTPADKGA